MQATSIGDLAQTLLLQQRSAALRNDMLRLNQEITTGKVYDVAEYLGGDVSRLSSLEYRLSVVEGFQLANREAASFTEAAQTRVTEISDSVGELGLALLSLGSSPVANSINASTEQAVIALENVVQNLNGSHAGRALFAGIDTDQSPIINSEALLDELRSVLAGATTADNVLSELAAWFDDPAGFTAFAYGGSTTSLEPFVTGQGRTVSYDIRADQSELRNALRDIAGAALASDPALGLIGAETSRLLTKSGEKLIASQDALIGVSATLGVAQETIERAVVRGETEKLALEQARNALIESDPFSAATDLEAVQFQLESLYALAVRTSQLSLVNYLR